MADNDQDGLRMPKDVRIDDIILISHTQIGISLINLFVELNLYEDIYSNTLSGDVILTDATNLLMNAPITGQDKIFFSFYTPGPNPSKISLLMNIYKVGERMVENDKKQIYTLHFCSQEQVRDNYVKVSHGYSGLQSEWIEQILTQPYGLFTKREYFIEPTKYETNAVIPRWNPLKALNWIAQRSISAESDAPDMLFYETVDGFQFRSIKTLMREDIKENYIFRPFGHHDLTAGRHQYQEIHKDFINISHFNVKANSDVIDLVRNGTFAQKLIIHDVATGEYREIDYDYFDDFEKSPDHLAGGKLIQNTPNLDEVRLNELPESHINVVADHSYLFKANLKDTKHYEHWLPRRTSLMQQYNAVTMELVVPGDTARRVGDVVELFIPSLEAFADDQYIPDKYLSGRWMIGSIRHHIQRDMHQMFLEVFKDGYDVPLPDQSEQSVEQ